MIFIEEKFAYKKTERYEFTYLDYLYYCNSEAWKKTVNGEYPIIYEEVMKALSSIRKNIKKNKQLEELKRIVMYLYENEGETTLKQIIKILEESECGENMSTIAERIAKELADDKKAARAEGMMLGIKAGILQTIRQMIKMNLGDDLIKQATGAKKTEIEEIRREISNKK